MQMCKPSTTVIGGTVIIAAGTAGITVGNAGIIVAGTAGTTVSGTTASAGITARITGIARTAGAVSICSSDILTSPGGQTPGLFAAIK